MASAFDWSPGGCCCGPPLYCAMGVDNIEQPTITRIPRSASVTYSGAIYVVDNGAGIYSLDCGNPGHFNSMSPVSLTAQAPTYPSGSPIGYPAPGQNHFMTWTRASGNKVINPVWPGMAGGEWIPNDAGQLLVPPFGITPTLAGWGYDGLVPRYFSGAGTLYDQFTHATEEPVGFGVPEAYCRVTKPWDFAELSLICGPLEGEGYDDTLSTNHVRLFYAASLDAGKVGSAFSAPLQLFKILDDVPYDVPFTVYEFHPADPSIKHRICVIPDTISLDISDSFFDYGPPVGPKAHGYFYHNLTIEIRFSDWYEGPIQWG
jgi:hypothetical protein